MLSNQILIYALSALVFWGYWIIFLTSILEATPIFGFLSPGQVFVAIGGFMAKLGILNLWQVLLAAAAGALIGDTMSYVIGNKYGNRFIHSFIGKYGKYFFLKKEHFFSTKKLMKSHMGKVLIMGRFNSVTRAFGPFVAGFSDVSHSRFMLYNVVGSILWAVTFVLIGYLFGESYEIISNYMNNVTFAVLTIIAIAWYTLRHFRKLKEKE